MLAAGSFRRVLVRFVGSPDATGALWVGASVAAAAGGVSETGPEGPRRLRRDHSDAQSVGPFASGLVAGPPEKRIARRAATGPLPMSAAPYRWTFCSQGHIHIGANGGAGLMLRHVPDRGEAVYLLAEKSRWFGEEGAWGIPGGAIHESESVEVAARREAAEEIWPLPPYHVTGLDLQDCGGWQFHIVRADVSKPFATYAAREADATGWFTLADMQSLRMHPILRKWAGQNGQRGP